jgi:hypothetical protein
LSVFDDAASAALATARAVAGNQVTYRRGASSAQMTAVSGSTRYKFTNESGVTITITGRDYLIAVADLVLDSAPVTPLPGDVVDDGVHQYEAMPVGGEACFAHSDSNKTQFRIHTKLVN